MARMKGCWAASFKLPLHDQPSEHEHRPGMMRGDAPTPGWAKIQVGATGSSFQQRSFLDHRHESMRSFTGGFSLTADPATRTEPPHDTIASLPKRGDDAFAQWAESRCGVHCGLPRLQTGPRLLPDVAQGMTRPMVMSNPPGRANFGHPRGRPGS